jgi:hypothetical protein
MGPFSLIPGSDRSFRHGRRRLGLIRAAGVSPPGSCVGPRPQDQSGLAPWPAGPPVSVRFALPGGRRRGANVEGVFKDAFRDARTFTRYGGGGLYVPMYLGAVGSGRPIFSAGTR